jgi:hypothetical protein
VSHSKPHTDPMHQHQLGKKQHAPESVKFKNAGAVAAGGTGVQVELDALTTALTNLQGRSDTFTDTVNNAAHLDRKLPNGSGPVAESMADLFQHRLGAQGGVQYALHAHLHRLNSLVDNLHSTVTGYQDSEQQALNSIQAVPATGAQPA